MILAAGAMITTHRNIALEFYYKAREVAGDLFDVTVYHVAEGFF